MQQIQAIRSDLSVFLAIAEPNSKVVDDRLHCSLAGITHQQELNSHNKTTIMSYRRQSQ